MVEMVLLVKLSPTAWPTHDYALKPLHWRAWLAVSLRHGNAVATETLTRRGSGDRPGGPSATTPGGCRQENLRIPVELQAPMQILPPRFLARLVRNPH
jgi:hypothetical protein